MLKQSTAYTKLFFMVSSTDHLSAKTAAVPVVNLSKAGAAFGAAGGAVTEIANGWYKVALTTTDTNTLGDLAFHITGTGADDCDLADQIFASSIDDLSKPGTAQTITANQAVNVAQWNGTNVVAPATAGIPRVAVEAAADFAQAAADKVWSSATRTLTAFSTALAQSVWDVLDANISVASSVGLRLKGLTFTTANKVDAAFNAAADFPQACADKIWSSATRALTDKVGFALSAAGVQAIWDALTSALTTVGSIGKLLVTNLDTNVGSRSTYAGTDTAGTTTLLTRIGTPAGASVSADIAALPTAAAISTKVQADAVATPLQSNVKKINDVTVNGTGSSGTPWGP